MAGHSSLLKTTLVGGVMFLAPLVVLMIWSGSMYLMTEDRIRPTTVPVKEALKGIRRVGMGANELLRSQL